MFVSLELAKQHLAIVSNEWDNLIQLYAAGIENSVQYYTHRKFYNTDEELAALSEKDQKDAMKWSDAPELQTACLLLLGHLFMNRETSKIGDVALACNSLDFFMQPVTIPVI